MTRPAPGITRPAPRQSRLRPATGASWAGEIAVRWAQMVSRPSRPYNLPCRLRPTVGRTLGRSGASWTGEIAVRRA
ncbi:MAG: hypothetical protein GY803_30300 [Chloroflexi bacterium]|nr:hypothetical protein [Chloroflexota bacterium]